LRAQSPQCSCRNFHVSSAVGPAIAAVDMVFLSVKTSIKVHGIGAGEASDLRRI
jgi:UDPglucose 6-dehydrogenase